MNKAEIDARRVNIHVRYDNTDITSDITKNITSISYTDNEEDKADDLQITVEDAKGLWHGDWFPDKGAELHAILVQKNWRPGGRDITLDCGVFEIDSVGFSGPPDVATLKAASVPCTANIRQEKKSKAWEAIALTAIVGEIAEKNGLSFMYECDEDPFYDRVDQNQESDIAFLKRLAEKEGLNVKVTSKVIVIFNEVKYEQKPSVGKLIKGASNILSYKFDSTMNDTAYSSCKVSYTDPKTKKTIEYTYKPRDAPSDAPVLKINERVNSREEARKLAMKRLRQKNKKEFKASFSVVGDLELCTGVTLDVVGFRRFDGKYIVQKASHNVTGGYTTELELRRVLEGY